MYWILNLPQGSQNEAFRKIWALKFVKNCLEGFKINLAKA
jgi:hypothetical protein